MARIFQVPASYPGRGGRSRSRSSRGGRCRCPSGARMLSTRGHGRGFVCQSSTPKIVRKRGRSWKIKKPFVRAICG